VNNHALVTGGALDCGTGTPLITGCRFISNWGTSGGAVSVSGSSIIIDCEFVENSSDIVFGSGGALAVWGPSPKIVNCIFRDNYSSILGGGVFLGEISSALIVNSTFSDNDAPEGSCIGLFEADSLVLTNNILVFGGSGEAVSGSGTVSISYCDVYGNAGGDWTGAIAGHLGINGNICADPFFVNRQHGDLHIKHVSPCRDSGNNNASGLPDEDCEGDPRIGWSKIVDMGADEFYTHLYCTGDMIPGGAIEGKLVGIPGTSPTGLFFGSAILETPLSTAWGDFYLQAPWWLVPLVPIPAEGILILPATIPHSPPAPHDLPMQALIGLNPESLTNLEVLEVR
jgi:hypothetical protein